MPKNDQRDNEPRVFRIHTQPDKTNPAGVVHEVTAAYYQHVNGFVTFKDNAGQAVYAAREDLVSQIERLRTHVILAIAHEELELILTALAQRAAILRDGAREPEAAEQVATLAESLERLRDIAGVREAEDVSSLPRSKPLCTCQISFGNTGNVTTLNPGCEVHRTTSNALVG
jgi:hypothetical protein